MFSEEMSSNQKTIVCAAPGYELYVLYEEF